MNIRLSYLSLVLVGLLPIACAQALSQTRSGGGVLAAESNPPPALPQQKPRTYIIDSWEASPNDELPKNCTTLDQSLIVPIPGDHRAEAIARLANVASRRLTEKQVVAILGFRNQSDASASGRIGSAISELTRQKRLAEEQRKGSWSLADRDRLQTLAAFASSPTAKKLKPYLLRGVAKYEYTGGFKVSSCGSGVFVVWHLSLGLSPSPSTRLPLVAFLETAPTKIFVYASAIR